MKNCNKCKETKELSAFGSDKRNSDGLQGICNICKMEDKQLRRDNRVKNKEYRLITEKTCNKCATLKSIDQFFKDKAMSDGHSSICKACKKETVYKWRQENRLVYNALAVKWRDKNPDKQHATDIKRNYGLSIEDYNKMLMAQGMQCALCDTQHDPSKKRGRLYVDHCHTTGKVRALLCSAHNSMLGYAEDQIDTLQKAIDYLKKHST